MAFIPVPNGVEVVLKGTKDGQEVINVFGVDNGSPADSGDLQDINDAFTTWWEDEYRTITHESFHLDSINCIALDTASSPNYERTSFDNPTGGVSGDALANNVTLAVKHLTLSRGRSFRGRTYLVALPDNFMFDADHVSAGSLTTIIEVLTALVTLLLAIDKFLVVISRFADLAPRMAGIMTEITAMAADNIVDSQRRRLPGRGA